MNTTPRWGLFQKILPEVPFRVSTNDIINSEYYRAAEGIFRYLTKFQHHNGAIVDPNAHATLDYQYQYANLGLSAVIMYVIWQNPLYIVVAERSLSYYAAIPVEKKKEGVDFSNLSVLLSSLLVTETEVRYSFHTLIQQYVARIAHFAQYNDRKLYGNNFVNMRAVNHLLRYKLLEYPDDKEQAYFLITASLGWQLPDGIFYDYPRSFHDPTGIPSLTYHAKMTLMTLLFGLISKEDHIINAALRGLDALACLIAHDGEAFYYGRSNNALYGYACGIYAMQLAAAYLKTGDAARTYQLCAKKLTSFIMRHQAPDGHLYIVPNDDENSRCGYDSYMYVTVYNAFAMSMLLLSAIVHDIPGENVSEQHDGCYHLKDSGFVIKKEKRLAMAINVKGHNFYQQYLLDPRYTGGTPLYLKYKGTDILPTIPFSYPAEDSPLKRGAFQKVVRTIRRAAETMRQWEYLKRFNPLYAGFLPCIETTEKLYMPLHTTSADVIQTPGIAHIQLTGHLTAITRKGFQPLLLVLGEIMARSINVPLYRLRQRLVKATTLPFERHIIFGDDFCAFSECLPPVKGGRYFFTLRTYASWEYKAEKDYVVWAQKNGYCMIMPVPHDTAVRQYATVGSSKGWARCWKVEKLHEHVHAQRPTQKELHIILFFDHTPPSQQVHACLQHVYAQLNKHTPHTHYVSHTLA